MQKVQRKQLVITLSSKAQNPSCHPSSNAPSASANRIICIGGRREFPLAFGCSFPMRCQPQANDVQTNIRSFLHSAIFYEMLRFYKALFLHIYKKEK